ncbi:MAG TPA: FGGY family carbohydrate kinase, partial [Anaerolineae bacterium]|nr:FGGY family carbohydrate kinase [Anaerolineae bacterium]
MGGPYVIGIDFGTESVRVGIFDQAGQPVAFASQEYPLYHPHPGWAEQKPDEWWAALVKATRAVLDKSGIAKEEIVGLGADCT